MRAFTRELAWDLRGNRVNASLSFLALLVAMLSFVLISVLARIGTDALVAQSEQLNGRAVTLSASLPVDGWSTQRIDGISTSIETWHTSGAEGSIVLDRAATMVLPSGEIRSATVRLTSPEYRSIRRVVVTRGRWFTGNSYPGEVAINAAAAALLNTNVHYLTLDLGYLPHLQLNVVGLVADGNPQPVVYADVQAFQGGTAIHQKPDQALILIHTGEAGSEQVASLVKDSLTRAGLHDAIEVNRADQSAQIKDSLSVLSNVFLVVALIGLIVAVLGMINVGLASVRERSRDFTIRRAMGATRSRVIASVAASTLVVGLAATLVAVALSYGAVTLLVPHLVDPNSAIGIPAYPWPVAAAAAAGGVIASLLSGLAPALRTRSLDLAALLRE